MIALASDHAGFELKNIINEFLTEKGFTTKDYGCFNTESCNYAEFGFKAAAAVAAGECERGVLVCGTGIGISLAANKVKGIRCAPCSDCFSAKLSKEHNDTNMLALGSRVVGRGLACMIVDVWLNAEFQGARHALRTNQIMEIENGKTF